LLSVFSIDNNLVKAYRERGGIAKNTHAIMEKTEENDGKMDRKCPKCREDKLKMQLYHKK